MNYQQRVPDRPPLRGVVEVMFLLDGYLPGHSRERVVPNGRVTLVIELDGRERHVYDNATGEVLQTCRGAWLSGVHRNHLTIGDTEHGNRLVAVQFVPGGARAIAHANVEHLQDLVVPADQVLGDGVHALREQLLQAGGATACLDALQVWLEQRHNEEFAPPVFLTDAVHKLVADPGIVRLTELSADAGVSHRHFLDVFRQHVGTTPKSLQRVLRFYSVFERIQGQERVDWAALADELGYSDQAHFVREFRAFSGYRPTGFLRQGHDRENFFPDV